MFKKHNRTDETKLYRIMCFFHYISTISHYIVLHNKFYSIIFMYYRDFMKLQTIL